MTCDVDLMIGTLVVPLHARLQMTQTYSEVDAVSHWRSVDGTSIQQVHFDGKLATQVEASGWVDHGLVGAGLRGAFDIACSAPRGLAWQAGTAFTLPAGKYRTDVDVFAIARVGTDMQRTAATRAGDTVTVTAVAGANLYQVSYYPLLRCHVIAKPPVSTDRRTWRWTMNAEEI